MIGAVQDGAHGTPAGLRAAHGRGTTGPPRPPLVHRRARPAQVRRHLPRGARDRLRGGHAVRRLGHRRLQPRAGERRARPARRQHLPAACRWATDDETSARIFCDIANLDGTPVRGRPAAGPAPQPRRGGRRRASSSCAPPRSSSSTSPTATRRRRRSRSTTPATSTSPPSDVARDLRRRTIHRLEAMGIPVEYSFHEDAPSQHEIDLRYTDALSMADNVMTLRLVVREVAMARAACTPPSCRSRSPACRARACTPTCRSSRATTTPSTTPTPTTACPRSASASSPGCCAHAREITAVTNQLVNSYKRLDRRLRGPGPHLLGPQQPRRARAGSGAQAGQGGPGHPHRVPRPRPRLQPVPRVLGAAGRGPEGHRARATSCPTEASANLFEITRGAAPSGIAAPARNRSPTPST